MGCICKNVIGSSRLETSSPVFTLVGIAGDRSGDGSASGANAGGGCLYARGNESKRIGDEVIILGLVVGILHDQRGVTGKQRSDGAGGREITIGKSIR